jgi:hypothetical protein
MKDEKQTIRHWRHLTIGEIADYMDKDPALRIELFGYVLKVGSRKGEVEKCIRMSSDQIGTCHGNFEAVFQYLADAIQRSC